MGAIADRYKNQTIYIIHGWTYTIDPWKPVVKQLEHAGYNVRLLRVPGLTSPSNKEWDIKGYVAWLHEELGAVKNPIVVGHSNGGRIAMNYLVTHPGSFSKLILLNSAGINVSNTRISIKRSVIALFAKVLKPLKYIPAVKGVLVRLIGATDYDKAPPHMKKTLRNMLESDAYMDASLIKVPTILLWGAEDRITPPAAGKKLQQLIPGSILKIVPDWRHAPYKTHPAQLASFLQEAVRGDIK